MTKFNELNISEEMIRAIEEMGYEEATDIQVQSIPLIMQGKDVLGRSNTGTGKTAAFGIPCIEIVEVGTKFPQALIIVPTRELVTQVATELRKFSKYKEGVKIVPIYGGQPIDRQIQLLKRGCTIVVGTPGRIMDHLRRKTLKLTDAKMIILDEADEMLNMGFKEDIEEILKSMPEENNYQTTLFSATMPSAIMKITEKFQKDPVHIEIKSAQRTIDTVEQVYYDIPRGKKTNALRVLLYHFDPELCMIFTNTKKMVDELTQELNSRDIKAVGLHGDMKQQARDRVMEQFRSGKYPILIATDVAARGIDVDNITLVINYDIPQDNEYYIHRIGRTGRAGKKGRAVTLISGSKQKSFIRDIMRYTKTNIERESLPTSDQLKEANKAAFIAKVKEAVDSISKDSTEMANELMAEGIAIENILSALIGMNFKNETIDLGSEATDKKKASRNEDFECKKIKIDCGRDRGISPANIVCAIAEETGLTSSIIGKIDVMARFTLVDIDATHIDKVLESMQGCVIKGSEVTVVIDEGNHSSSRSSDRGSRGGDRGSRGGDRGSRGGSRGGDRGGYRGDHKPSGDRGPRGGAPRGDRSSFGKTREDARNNSYAHKSDDTRTSKPRKRQYKD
ncbi:MAG: DEAD/DEAH box helicase [Erysipelotrichaceae bacterium]